MNRNQFIILGVIAAVAIGIFVWSVFKEVWDTLEDIERKNK